MFEPFRTRDNVSEALQSLLQLYPHEVNARSKVILTTFPGLWDREETREHTKLIDLSALLGSRAVQTASESNIEAGVSQQFVDAGWPRDSVITQYRPSLKSSFVTDIAVFGLDRSWQVAVEIKYHDMLNHRRVTELFNVMRHETTASWFCVTDGMQFHLVSREGGEHRLLERAPSPVDLEITVTWDGRQSQSHQASHIVRPSSPEELLANVSEYQPEALIMDSTTLTELRPDREAALYNLMPFVGGTLFDDVRIRPSRRSNAHDILLAWITSIPSLKALSAIVPQSFALNSSSHWLRELLSNRFRLCGVLELPPDIFRPVRSTATSILYFGGEREKVYFDALASRGDLMGMESRTWFESLSKWMQGTEPSTGYTTNIDSLTLWSFGANDPEIEDTLQRLRNLGELKSIEELCEISRGIHLRDRDTEVEDGVALIEGRSLRDGYLDLENARKVQAEGVPEQSTLHVDDILLPEIVTERSSFVLNRSNEAAILSRGVIALRLKSDLVSPEYLSEYLNSSTARKLITARATRSAGTHFQHLTIPLLREIPVPVINGSLYQGLSETQQIEAELRSKADELESLRRSLFEARKKRDFQSNLGDLKRLGKVLSASIRIADRLEFQVANFYPFPVAFGFRLLTSIIDRRERYGEQLRVVENMLAFLGSTSLALLEEQDRIEANIQLKKYWRGGISLGGWKKIVQDCAKVFATYKDHPLASSIQRLNIGSERKGFGADVAALINARNKHHHGQGPTIEEDVISASNDLDVRLRRCIEALAFFTEYPIYEVRDINFNLQGDVVLRCLSHIGDHPGLAQEELVVPREKVLLMPPRKNNLFLDLGRHQWIALYPFINVMACQNCKAREIYFIDKWSDERGAANLKSFERGHSESSSEISNALIEWTSNE